MTETESKPKTKRKNCENCGTELDEDEVYELDGTILCWDCYNEEDLRNRRRMDRVTIFSEF